MLAAMEGDSYRAEATFRRRNGSLVEKKKKLSDGRCSVCQFKFSERYEGIEAFGLIAHHVEPIGNARRRPRRPWTTFSCFAPTATPQYIPTTRPFRQTICERC